MARAYLEAKTSDSDLAITFEAHGESITLYIPAETMRLTSKATLIEQLSDPVSCSLCCYKKSGFAACMARCLYGDGKCCDSGATDCE